MAKITLLLLALFYIISCKPVQQNPIAETKDTIITTQEVTEIIDTLSSDYYLGRGFGSKGIEKAAVYIENYLQKLNITPYFETYRDSFVVRNDTGYNIVGLIEGTDPELKKDFVILSAHYDHVGTIKSETDSIKNGANDNASGVSSVLNIAKHLVDNKLNKRSVIVALFSGEEIGLTGSEHFAKKVAADSSQFYCCLNIDMIGSQVPHHQGKSYLSGGKNYSNMFEKINEYAGTEAFVTYKKGFFDVFRLSDNYPIYGELNIPSHTFCTFDFTNYEHYHRVSDEIENVDLENTATIVRNIAKAVVGVANSKEREIKLKDE